MQITAEHIADFHRDGVVMLPGVFEQSWVDLLSEGLDQHLGDPTSRARVWDRDDNGATMLWDSMAWHDVPQYQQFVFDSPAAELAGRLLESRTVNFFFDAVFVRSAGSQFETPWHQDEPYWSVSGYDTCTVWMPLDSVKAKNALAFVPGSHLGAVVFDNTTLESSTPTEKSMSTAATSRQLLRPISQTSTRTETLLGWSAGTWSLAIALYSTVAFSTAVQGSWTLIASSRYSRPSGSATTCGLHFATKAWTPTSAKSSPPTA